VHVDSKVLVMVHKIVVHVINRSTT